MSQRPNGYSASMAGLYLSQALHKMLGEPIGLGKTNNDNLGLNTK